MKTDIKAHLFLFVATLIFGGNYWVSKFMLPKWVNPMEMIFLRVGGAVVLFWVVGFFFPKQTVEKKDLMYLAICALFGVALNQVLFFKGLNLTHPVDASVIHLVNPVLVLLLAALFLRETITWQKILGVALGLSGALLLIVNDVHSLFSSQVFWGNLMIFSNTLAYALYLVLSKPLMNHYHPITVMKWVFLFGFIEVLPFCWKTPVTVDWASYTLLVYGAVFYIVVLVTFLAYWLTISALKHVQASTAGFYIYLQPLIAGVIAWMVGSRAFYLQQIVSALLIATGVFFVSIKNNRKQILHF